jgi:5-methyltetrahydrofolate--homocysteine methyltransferase
LYAKDAMEGLDLLERIRREGAASVVADQERTHAKSAPAAAREGERLAEGQERSRRVDDSLAIPPPPDRARHLVEFSDLDEVWSYVNPQMLYGKHLGFRGKAERALAAGDPQMLKLVEQMDAVRDECRAGAMQLRAVYRWFAAEGRGNELLLFADDASTDPIARWRFPRQRQADGLCISDFVLSPRDGRRDSVALFVTTAVGAVAQRAEMAKKAGEYVRSHGLQALALESAEAAAELLHQRLRKQWGAADPKDITAAQIFRADYRGKRYSFGYPACPDLAGQRALFALLQPEDAGVTLTEGDMMEPEASVSALVFHHPDAVYFAADA